MRGYSLTDVVLLVIGLGASGWALVTLSAWDDRNGVRRRPAAAVVEPCRERAR